ncbi:MAG TPA: menaquinone biosynthesis protein [Chitinophagaceae bacterium]|nr:menaquinone biosynthesis protein [Chitinophagaceae bacterium]
MHANLVELEKIKVGAVSYLNTKPLLYGIKRSEELMARLELIEEYPSKIADMLVEGTIDVGLVPVAVIPKLKEWNILPGYCIGANGDVASVCLFSEVPIDKIERILLDYQSRTSVNLCKILLKYYWKKEVVLEDAGNDFTGHVTGTTAGVIIGDRALLQRKKSAYIYDLAGTWKTMTGLPFVFAAWIANKKLPPDFIELFTNANAVGLNNIDKVIAENPFSEYALETYYHKNISYPLTEDKMQGMNKFLGLLAN